jgi:predicted Na+-dependent transporter
MKLIIYPFLITLLPIVIGLILKYITTKIFPKFPKVIVILTTCIIGVICMIAAVILSANSIDSKCANGAIIFIPIGMGTTVFGILINQKNNIFKF